MIEVTKNYKVTLTEEQARQLYELLESAKSQNYLSYGDLYSDLRDLYHALENKIDSEI